MTFSPETFISVLITQSGVTFSRSYLKQTHHLREWSFLHNSRISLLRNTFPVR